MESRIFIGPAGWSYPDWKGRFYPAAGEVSRDYLQYTARYFNLVEINSTFYRTPGISVCKSWESRVAAYPDFLFTAKLNKVFTHGDRQAGSPEIDKFKTSLSPLLEAGRLAFVLAQFPWSFKPSAQTRSYIEKLSYALKPFPLSIEVRHGDWASKESLDFFREANLTLCRIDQPQLGCSLSHNTSVFGPFGSYFRLHGRNASEWFRPGTSRDLRYDYYYSENEMNAWAKSVKEEMKKPGKVFVVFNNHFRGQAAANAVELKSLVLGRTVAAPPPLIKAFPRLKAMTRSEPIDEVWGRNSGQRSLFNNIDEEEQED